MTLALSYRPLRLAEVVGQQHVTPILRAMAASENVHSALLLSGSRGTGKTSCARIFAAALNCENRATQSGDACGSCTSCVSVQSSNSVSVLEIDAASNGGVDEVRRIQEMCAYAHDAEWRVIILDEAQSLSREANNALLKLSEEAPERTVIILVTTEPEKILETLHSRAMTFEFHRIRTEDLVSRLQQISDAEGLEVSPELLFEISKSAQGGLRDAVMTLDQVSRVGIKTVDDFFAFFGIQDYSVPLMWAAIRGDHAEGYKTVDEHFSRTGEASGMVSNLSRLVTDLLVLKSRGVPPNYGESALAERIEMANAVSSESLVRVIEILWELRTRTRASENDQRSSMEMAFALIANSISPVSSDNDVVLEQKPVQPILPTRNESSERLSLEEMAAFSI